MTKMSVAEANAFLSGAFSGRGSQQTIEVMEEGRAVARLVADDTHLRPGGYISGPTQMSLADTVAYMVVMTKTGLEPMAVTSDLTIHFLRPCIGATVVADGRLVSFSGRRALIEVDIRIEGADKPASHVVVAYALPAKT
jgi:uncharacterized protein (TIGR00369 family)